MQSAQPIRDLVNTLLAQGVRFRMTLCKLRAAITTLSVDRQLWVAFRPTWTDQWWSAMPVQRWTGFGQKGPLEIRTDFPLPDRRR